MIYIIFRFYLRFEARGGLRWAMTTKTGPSTWFVFSFFYCTYVYLDKLPIHTPPTVTT